MFNTNDRYKLTKLIVDNNKKNTFEVPLMPINIKNKYKWITETASLPWLNLAVSVPYWDFMNEILAVEREEYFVPHRADQYEHRGWTSFCIHGKSWNSTRETQHYNDDRPYRFTKQAIDLMPKTVKFFKNNFISI